MVRSSGEHIGIDPLCSKGPHSVVGGAQVWLKPQFLLLHGSVALGKLFNLSVSHFPHP